MAQNIDWLESRLNGQGAVVVLDGGMGTFLEQSGVPMDGDVWSAAANLDHPIAVRRAHETYIHSGAEVIITNTFSASRHMLEPGGLGDQVETINQQAVKLAKQACDNAATGPVAIAGSICEWTASDSPRWHDPDALGDSVREQAEILAHAGVDMIALEMCEQAHLSRVAIREVFKVGLPVWIGISARKHPDHGQLSTFNYPHESFTELLEIAAGSPVMMINIMHTAVTDIARALSVVRQFWSGPVGIYPECGYFKMPNWQFVDVMAPQELSDYAETWMQQGVRMIGGCCGIGPQHIDAVNKVVQATECS